MARPLLALLLVALLPAACAGRAKTVATPPPLLLDQRGTIMPFERAVTHIAFRPLIPSTQVLAYAVLPPLGGTDTDAHRGLGIEYVMHRRALLLSQWPKGPFDIAFGTKGANTPPCTPTHYSPTGIAWITTKDVVMTLQPDGNIPNQALEAEARRLIRAGACR